MSSEQSVNMLSVKQAAQHLGVSLGSVYSLCAGGLLDHFRIGTRRGAIRIALADLLAYLQRSRRGSGEIPGQSQDSQTVSQRTRAAAIRPFRHIQLPNLANQEG